MSRPVAVSFEFFPPSDDARPRSCGRGRSAWRRFGREFVSVTYGADGSTRTGPTNACCACCAKRSSRSRRTSPASAPPREEMGAIAQDYWRHGVRHVVALRGDVPGVAPGLATSELRRIPADMPTPRIWCGA